jgi:GNAT superfamily N-acetyltransferase
MNEAIEPIDPIHSAMMLGMTPEPCEPIIEITRQAVTKLLDVVEFGDQLERVEKDRLVAFVKELLAEPQPELWAMHSVGPNEVHPMISKEEAERQAASLIALCKERLPDIPITVNVIPSPYSPFEHFEILAEELTEQVASLREALDKKKAEAAAPAVVNQQVTTAAVAPDALEQARRHLSNAIEDAEDGKTAAALPALREVAHYLAQVAAPAPKTMGVEAICGKYGNVLRPFMAMMEAELHANTGKGDRPAWLAMSPEQCLLEIYYHTAKLQKAVKNNDMKGVREYTADVANTSMMLADTCGWLDVVSGELAANEQKSMVELIRQHRIAVTPEHEGQWHADLYGSEAEPLARAEGATPEAAVAAVVALYLSLQEQQP